MSAFAHCTLLVMMALALSAAPGEQTAAAPSVPPPITCSQAERLAAGHATPSPDLVKAIAGMRALYAKPHDPGAVEYTLAELYPRAKQFCTAMTYLKKTVDLHQGWDPSNDPLMRNMNRIGQYQDIVRELAIEFPAVHTSSIAFTLHEPDMIPENVSFDPASGNWYVSSIYFRKVVKVDPSGRARDFLRPRQYGLWAVIGMRVDPATHSLWICTAALNEAKPVAGSSALLNVDLKTGKLLHKYVIAGGKTSHLFNDLVLDRSGNVYISDSLANTMYWLPSSTHALAVLIPGLALNFPNGIDLDPTQRYLYVAYSYGGIDILDLRTKKYHALAHPPNVTIEGIDGMYYYRGSLVSIQNGIGTERVTRFYLDVRGDRIVRAETLEYRNPILQQSTEGGISGSTLYYVANSQNFWLMPDGKLDRSHTFVNPVILKLDLK